MDDDDDEILFPLVTQYFNFKAKATRVLTDVVLPFEIEIEAEFDYSTDDDEKVYFGITKIQYWIDHVVDNSIMFAVDNKLARDMFLGERPKVANMIMIMPDEPDDTVFVAVMLAKLQAIAGDTIQFHSMRMKTVNRVGISVMMVKPDQESNILPTGAEWYGDNAVRFFDQPWWERGDGSSFDALPQEGQDVTVRPIWAFEFDFLNEKKPLGGVIKPPQGSGSTPTGAGRQFDPKIIDGGKK